MRALNEIIVHCTATPPDWRQGEPTSAKVAEVKRWHTKERGFNDIGYHFLIDRDGTVVTGRPLEKTGAHVSGHNTGTIGVSLFGGHGAAATDTFSDHFTPAQDGALRALLARLQDAYGRMKITGHNFYAAKGCPGFYVPSWLSAVATPAPAKPAPKPAETTDTVAQVLRWRLAEIRDLAIKALEG